MYKGPEARSSRAGPTNYKEACVAGVRTSGKWFKMRLRHKQRSPAGA